MKLRTYKITEDQYRAILAEQEGVCAICLKEPEDNIAGRELAIDHCHVTGRIRGLLCQMCNVGLGAFRDNAEHLMLASEYITQCGFTDACIGLSTHVNNA